MLVIVENPKAMDVTDRQFHGTRTQLYPSPIAHANPGSTKPQLLEWAESKSILGSTMVYLGDGPAQTYC